MANPKQEKTVGALIREKFGADPEFSDEAPELDESDDATWTTNGAAPNAYHWTNGDPTL
jgi:hypothetical protein